MRSARPSGLKMRQWWAAMRGLRRGSVVVRWAQAAARRLAVVGLDGVAAGLVMTREVSGERRVAFVAWGSARRATARGLGLGGVAAAGSAMRPTALGVGVAGGGMGEFLERFLGVDGDSVSAPSWTWTAGTWSAFLLREFAGGGGGAAAGGGAMALLLLLLLLDGAASAWALRRADRRLDILKVAMSSGDGRSKF